MSVKLKPGYLFPTGYKQTEVGVIPDDWRLKPLREVVTFLDGKRRPVKDVDRAKMRGSIPYYGASGIVDYVNDYLFDDELILLGEDGENILSRNCRLAFRISGKAWVNNHAHVLKPNPDISLGFLTDYLESLNYERFNSGTAQPKLNKQTCSGILVALPPTKAEQEAIAEALSDTDALIESLEQIISKKRCLKQGAMQELLTGKKRLPGFQIKPGYKQTEVGVIPVDWIATNLGDVCQIFGRIGFRGYKVSDIVPEGAGAIAVSPSNIRDSKIDLTRCTYISWVKYEESPEIKLFNDDILLVKTGSTFGKTAIIQNLEEKATLNPQLVVLKNIKINNSFLAYMMGFTTIQEQISEFIVGGALPTLSQRLVAQFKLPLPPNKIEQTAIAAILSDMDTEIATLETQLAKTRSLKQGMMHNLLTGRIRLIESGKLRMESSG